MYYANTTAAWRNSDVVSNIGHGYYVNAALFLGIVEDIWWKVQQNPEQDVLVLFYLNVPLDCFTRVLESVFVSPRVRCMTVDSAKGMEASHVYIVYVPRPEHFDLGGIQRDQNRFYQASMRAQCSVKYFVPLEVVEVCASQGASALDRRVKQPRCSPAFLHTQFWSHFQEVAAAEACIETWTWPWAKPSWLDDGMFANVLAKMQPAEGSDARQGERLTLWESLEQLSSSAEVKLPMRDYQRKVTLYCCYFVFSSVVLVYVCTRVLCCYF